MHIKFIVFRLFGCCLISLFISSCCQYAKVEYRTCDCKSYFSELQESFYLDKETGKRKIVAKEETDVANFIELVRSNAICFKGMGLKGIQKMFGKVPERIDEKLNRISYDFTTDVNTDKTRLCPTPLIINYASTKNVIYDMHMATMNVGGDYYQHTLGLLSKDRTSKNR